MAKFKTIDDLDSAIEKLVRAKIKHYYTDWRYYDRPKYMGFKGSTEPDDKELILIVHECGSELFTKAMAEKEGSEANMVLRYYMEQERTDTNFYTINLNELTLSRTA